MGELAYYIYRMDHSRERGRDGKRPVVIQGYDNAGNPIGDPITEPPGTLDGQTEYQGIRVYPIERKEEVTQFFQNKVAGLDYGAPSLKAEDFLTPDGRPISANDAVAKWKELFPNTELDDAQILAKVQDEMPRFQAVKQEDRDFARQGFTRDMYGLQSDAMKQGAQMRGTYGGMGSSMRGAYAGGQNLQQQYSFAEQDYKRDIYNLEQDAMSSYESDLANFATTAKFKEGGLVPNKKEETFLDVLARIPDAKGS